MSDTPSIPILQRLPMVRERAVQQLTQMLRLPAGQCQETYLFEQDRFCGVRFTLGTAMAVWKTNSNELQFFLDGQPYSQEANAPYRRAA